MQLARLLYALLPLTFLCLARDCNTDDIEKMSVSGCDCNRSDSKSCSQPCPLGCGITRPLKIRSPCNGCSTRDDIGCPGCSLYFGGLCTCLKAPSSGQCKASTQPKPGGTPTWVRLFRGELITTTQQLSGILDLGKAPNPDEGWSLAQSSYNRRSQALPINSARSRTQEQIHIHICNLGSNGQSIKKNLSSLPRSSYKTLSPVSTDLRCRVADTPGGEVPNVGRTIVNVVAHPPDKVCPADIGAAVITDDHDYSWVCITTDKTATEFTFCG
jgi:hypothetical protein